MNRNWTGIYTCKECHKTESRWSHTATDHKEGEQLEDRRNVGENSCNSGDGTDQTGPNLDVYDDDDDDDDIFPVQIIFTPFIKYALQFKCPLHFLQVNRQHKHKNRITL